MNKSETLTKIAPALLAAQKEIGAATKDAVNPFFKSKYADLGAVMEACKAPLNTNDITILQPVGTDEQGVYVETILLHSSGEYISDRMRISVKNQNDPQSQGSAISYARRYGLQSMVFIPTEDDDAEKATPHTTPSTQQTTAPRQAGAKNGASTLNKANAVCFACYAPSGKPHATNCTEVAR